MPNKTIFECKCCGTCITGPAAPHGALEVGWFELDGIDGTNSVCGGCKAEFDSGVDVLEPWREEYPNVRFAQ